MIVDHAGVYFFPEEYLYRFVGRFSFPIFFFLIGYTYQGLRSDSPEDVNRKWAGSYEKLPTPVKRLLRFFWLFNIKSDLLVCLLAITATNIALNHQILPLNILFTVIVCRIALYLLERYQVFTRWLFAAWLLLTLLHFPLNYVYEYGGTAILVSMAGYLVRRERRAELQATVFMVMSYLSYCASQMIFFPATFNYIVSLYAGIAVLFVLLSDYRFQKSCLLPNLTALNYVVMFISRYSLYVYTGHLLAFKLSSKFLIQG